jgi:hypothetical protein
MNMRARQVLLFLLLGCGHSANLAEAGRGDAGGADAPDAGLWPVSGATTLRFYKSPPGLGPPLVCAFDGGTMTGTAFQLTWPAGELSYSICDYGTTDREGRRVLAAGELAGVDQALRAVVVASSRGPSDGPFYSLTIDTPNKTLYWGDFVCVGPACVETEGIQYVIYVLDVLSP